MKKKKVNIPQTIMTFRQLEIMTLITWDRVIVKISSRTHVKKYRMYWHIYV